MNGTIYLLRGLPGSGKTSFAMELAYGLMKASEDELDVRVCSADDYFYENGPNPGVYDFDPTRLGVAHKQCQERVLEQMESPFSNSVIVANTLTTDKEMKPYIKMAQENDYKIVSLIVENRHGSKSIHNVPDMALDRMEERFTVKLK